MASRATQDDVVLAAARRVLRAAKSIVSQRELGVQVLRELRREDPNAAVTASRVRRLVAVQPFARVELRAGKASRDKILNKCPVCGSKLVRLKNQTLFGGEVTLTLRCPACKYWMGKEKRVPTLYIFHHVGPGGEAAPHASTPREPF